METQNQQDPTIEEGKKRKEIGISCTGIRLILGSDSAPNSTKPAKENGTASEQKSSESNTKQHAVATAKKQKTEAEEPREVPPAKNPPSTALFIKNFVRPFTKPAVQELLSKSGKIVEWAMDQIKSKCYVIYESQEQAIATREAVHNLKWPAGNNNKLFVEFVTEEEAKNFIANPDGIQKNTKKEGPQRKGAQDKPAAPAKTLDDLFWKTVAKPHIYWLPLTEEEVEQKKKQQSTNNNTSNTNENGAK